MVAQQLQSTLRCEGLYLDYLESALAALASLGEPCQTVLPGQEVPDVADDEVHQFLGDLPKPKIKGVC